MRTQFIVALILTTLGAGYYWYQLTSMVCPAPLEYRLGELGESFDISVNEAIDRIAEAEVVWEKAVGRDLFTYSQTADFTVDFIYDERQEKADSELTERDLLDIQRIESDNLKAKVESLQFEYKKLSTAYESKVVSYKASLDAYNVRVNKYNDRGGAPADVFKELEEERSDINHEAEAIAVRADELKGLVININIVSDEGNKLVENYNREVEAYNSEYGFTSEFTQGDYQGNRIHVYKFSSPAELQSVLIHEFGHALGLNHVAGSSSLMYYLLEESNQTGVLSKEDLAEYYAVCSTEETFSQKVRRVIRTIF